MDEKPYTITDRRGLNEGQEHPEEVCRVCGAQVVHSKEYGKPTMECIIFLNNTIAILSEKLTKQNDNPVTGIDD
jgi:hypothetical protein